MQLASFVAAALVVLLTPGPTNTLLAAAGAAMGFRRAVLLPLAEAAGYALAIGAFLLLTAYLSGVAFVMPALKTAAAVWLLVSAARLWRQPVQVDAAAHLTALRRVFVTTLLNPKAMLVGTILIPELMRERQALGLATFIALSSLAGAAWLTMGSLLPRPARPYAYKAAAIVLCAFSVAAASSTLRG